MVRKIAGYRLSRSEEKAMMGIHKKTRLSVASKKPFDRGVDVRGDIALFIPDGTQMSNKDLLASLRSDGRAVFFRLIDSKGVQQHTHGWIRYNPKTGLAEVTQYG